MAENYLYFSINGNNDADKEAVMFPASKFLGAVSVSNTALDFFFHDIQGAAGNDSIDCTIDAGEHETVMRKFASLAGRNRNNTNNFTVIKDLNDGLPLNEGPISRSGISEISAITVSIA